jgi:hypothetical protein
LLRRIQNDPPDVLYFGESTSSFVGPHDEDRRRLKTMVRDRLGGEVSFHSVDGASFSADIFDAYLRLLSANNRRPLVVVPLWIRGRFPPWIHHPVHGHQRAIQRIREVDPSQSWHRVHAGFKAPTQTDFDEFHRVPYSTLLGQGTVGDYVSGIAEYGRTGNHEARVRMLYAYHQGGLLEADGAEMEAVTRMGRTIQHLECEAIAYQTPSPVMKGTELLGEAMSIRTSESFRVLNQAYRAGAGEDAEIIAAGESFATDEFIDPNDASEHLNEVGRLRLAQMIVTAVKRRL